MAKCCERFSFHSLGRESVCRKDFYFLYIKLYFTHIYIHTHTLIHISTCAYSPTRAHNEYHYLKSCRSVGNRNEDEDEDDVEINLVKALTPLKKRPCPENSFVSQTRGEEK
jgi:hypothetical protein